MSQTIVALATPYGRSGIGVIRLSGAQSLEILRLLVQDNSFYPQPNKAVLKKIYDPHIKEVIDHALVTFFQNPKSFTGEDVVEISCHGSPIILRQIIDFCLEFGARLAQPGEFSLRALANQRMNLSQAEAIRDLIDAQTVVSARQAIRQLRGELSHQLQSLKDDLLNIIVLLESTLEFVEDDLPEVQIEHTKLKLNQLISELDRIAGTFKAGKLLREGIKVVFAGRPNVGKSSIFNALIGHERAIVTDIAGTTRDSLHETISIKGIPISLVDTAGLRETSDRVESIGVDRTKQIVADSDLVVVVLDGSQSLTTEDKEIINDTNSLSRLIAINKVDLDGIGKFDLAFESPSVWVSAKTNEGLDNLENAILKPFMPDDFSSSGILISNARHFDLIIRAKTEIEYALSLLETHSEEITLIGLHNAIRFLGEITGETTTEDVLTRIFSTFCIGK